MEGKNEIRQRMRLLRRSMKVEERKAASKAICAKLLERGDVCEAIANRRPIAVYLASPEEVDLTEFIEVALARGATIVAPRWNGALYELAPLVSLDNLIPGPHNILEPSESSVLLDSSKPSLWLLPGLAFTKNGKRLGYGGGWYDRFLSAAGLESVKLGIAFDFQVLEDLPTDVHDQMLTEVVS